MCQFHQRHTYKFFIQTSFRQLFFLVTCMQKMLPKRCSYEKFVHKMLMKLTAWLGKCLKMKGSLSLVEIPRRKLLFSFGDSLSRLDLIDHRTEETIFAAYVLKVYNMCLFQKLKNFHFLTVRFHLSFIKANSSKL